MTIWCTNFIQNIFLTFDFVSSDVVATEFVLSDCGNTKFAFSEWGTTFDCVITNSVSSGGVTSGEDGIEKEIQSSHKS